MIYIHIHEKHINTLKYWLAKSVTYVDETLIKDSIYKISLKNNYLMDTWYENFSLEHSIPFTQHKDYSSLLNIYLFNDQGLPDVGTIIIPFHYTDDLHQLDLYRASLLDEQQYENASLAELNKIIGQE